MTNTHRKPQALDGLTRQELLDYLNGMEQRVGRLEILSEQIRIASGWITKSHHG